MFKEVIQGPAGDPAEAPAGPIPLENGDLEGAGLQSFTQFGNSVYARSLTMGALRTLLQPKPGLTGQPVALTPDELQLSRGEALRDTAIVLSRHLAAVGVRTGDDGTVEELAEHSAVPVINMLTHLHHPCQALADLLTLREAYGSLRGLRLAYVGDGNNVAR